MVNAAAIVIAWLISFSLLLVLCALSSCRAQRHVETQGVNISEVASAQIGSRRAALLATSFPLELPVNLFRDSSQNAPGATYAPTGPSWVLAMEETSSAATKDYNERLHFRNKQRTPASSLRLIDYVCFAACLLGVFVAAIWYRRRQP